MLPQNALVDEHLHIFRADGQEIHAQIGLWHTRALDLVICTVTSSADASAIAEIATTVRRAHDLTVERALFVVAHQSTYQIAAMTWNGQRYETPRWQPLYHTTLLDIIEAAQ